MKLEIRPYIGVGPITFGMTAEEVRSILHCSYKEFKRTPMSKTTMDAFQPLGIFVCYDTDRKCNAVEMTQPAQPSYGVHELLGSSFAKVSELIRGLDLEVVLDAAGLTSFALGIGLYADGWKKNSLQPVESVIGFQRGYYEKMKIE